MKAKSGAADAAQDGQRALPSAMQARLFAPMSIGALLGLLIAVAVLPPLVFSVFLLERNNRAQQDVVATLAEATAGAAIATVDRQLQGMVTTLRGLSTSDSLTEGNLREFYVRTQTALAGTQSFLIVLDRNMNQMMNTRRPFDEQLGKTSDPQPAQQALETGVPVVSNGFFGRVAGQWVFNVILPWTPSGTDPMLLLLTQNAESLSDALAMENLRGGWNAVIVDNKGTVLASTLMSADVGKPFFLEETVRAAGAVRQQVSQDNKDYETISKVSDLSGWRVILWAERDVIQRPMFRTLRLLMLGGVAMMAVGWVAAWLFGRQISKSVRRLARDARRLGDGEEVIAETYPVRELGTVSAAMANAATQRRAAVNEIRFLMREVAHRSKNQLTVVSSIAKQSARNADSVAQFSESFQQRLMGLARSTDLLISGSVAGVELGELLKVQIEPFGPEDASRLRLEGPRLRLSLQAAQTLGLAIHEMATNAAKYGAFASPSGRLSVSWEKRGGDLGITWRERVASALERSDKKGFGTQLIERMLVGALGAKVDQTYHADGLEVRISLALDKVAPNPKHEDGDGDESTGKAIA